MRVGVCDMCGFRGLLTPKAVLSDSSTAFATESKRINSKEIVGTTERCLTCVVLRDGEASPNVLHRRPDEK